MVAISPINTSSMLADIVEDSAVTTGRRDAGTFFAAASFMQQRSTSLVLALNGIILTIAAFPEKVSMEQVIEPMMDSLIATYCIAAIGLWFIGAIFLAFYPITRERHERNVAILEARRAEAVARTAEETPAAGAAL